MIHEHGASKRIVFMGTPDFSVPSLRALVESSEANNWKVVAVATQPDRRAGRGNRLVESPVKEVAQEYDIPVLQPAGFRKHAEAVEDIRAYAPDLLAVAAYGIILPAPVLEIPVFGSVNVHASLLPALRGASPINTAILQGDTETGVSIMLMDQGMDTGPVLNQTRAPILPDDTAETLSVRLAEQGAEALVRTLVGWFTGTVAPIPQSELPGETSICHMIRKEHGRIDWRKPAEYIERMTRAYTPWPSAYTTWRGLPLKIHRAAVQPGAAEPGLVVQTDWGPAVGSGEDLLLLQEVQPAGKRAMDAESFVHGAADFIGITLGDFQEA